jgi:hypothetical protein
VLESVYKFQQQTQQMLFEYITMIDQQLAEAGKLLAAVDNDLIRGP